MKIHWNRSIGWNIDNMKMKLPDGIYRLRSMDSNPKQLKRMYGMEWEKMNVTQIITDGADCYPWMETFFIFPRKSVNGRLIWWRKAFKRRVWIVWGTGFHMEPEVQYADLDEILGMDYAESNS